MTIGWIMFPEFKFFVAGGAIQRKMVCEIGFLMLISTNPPNKLHVVVFGFSFVLVGVNFSQTCSRS